MSNDEVIAVLESLMDGVDPETHEFLGDNHVCLKPQVMWALHVAITALRKQKDCIPYSRMYRRNGKLNAGRPWSKEDDEELIRLFNDGMAIDEICEKTQRRKRGIVNRLLRLDLLPLSVLSGNNAGKRWTTTEEQYLVEIFKDKLSESIDDIAVEMKRNPRGISKRLENLGLLPIEDDATEP